MDENNKRVAFAATMAHELKRSMRDPDSFKLTSVRIIDKTGSICYEYRAHNGFGGVNVGFAVFSSKGTFKTDEMSGFLPIWNRECAHKLGMEELSAVSYLVDHAPMD